MARVSLCRAGRVDRRAHRALRCRAATRPRIIPTPRARRSIAMGLIFNNFASASGSMLGDEFQGNEYQPRRANTTSVLVLLAGAAIALSYLWAYAFTDALVKAGLLSP